MNTVAILPGGGAEYEDEEVGKTPLLHSPTPPTLHSDPTCGPPRGMTDRQTDKMAGSRDDVMALASALTCILDPPILRH